MVIMMCFNDVLFPFWEQKGEWKNVWHVGVCVLSAASHCGVCECMCFLPTYWDTEGDCVVGTVTCCQCQFTFKRNSGIVWLKCKCHANQRHQSEHVGCQKRCDPKNWRKSTYRRAYLELCPGWLKCCKLPVWHSLISWMELRVKACIQQGILHAA